MIENIFVAIILIVFFLLLWLCAGLILQYVLKKLSIYDKILYTHKFKIPEKYSVKKSPIYELVDNEWNTGSFYIKKWSLQYYEKEGHMFLSIFLLYPTLFLTYGYQVEDTVFLCEKKDIENITGTLEDNYERIWASENEEYLTKRALKDKQHELVDLLNKEFIENYE